MTTEMDNKSIRSAGDRSAADESKKLEEVKSNSKAASVANLQEMSLYPDWESLKVKESAEVVNMAKRDAWTNKLEFIMAAMSTAVGLGNVWRFAATAFSNGGGAFLLPYIIIIAVIGIPLYFYELSLGQFASGNLVVVWDAVPIVKGIGYSTLLISVCTMLYYCFLLAIAFRFLFAGFASDIPWDDCLRHAYAKEHRFIFNPVYNFTCLSKSGGSGASFNYAYYDKKMHVVNGSYVVSNQELYFKYAILKSYDNLGNGLGIPDGALAGCLVLVWALIFLNLIFGAKSFGKCSYFTALFPYFVLLILFIASLTQDGAGEGIRTLLQPDWAKIMEGKVWFEALVQAFFSLGIGYGGVVTYGSYNPFRQSGVTESLIICGADTLTSIFGGITVFAALGSLARKTGKKVEDVVTRGGGLAFITYPQVLSTFPIGASQFLSFCFFSMLVVLGLGSGSSFVTVLCVFLFDRFPKLNAKKIVRITVTGLICAASCLIGLIFTTPGGMFILELLDFFAAGYLVFVTVTLSVTAIAYVYGFKNFMLDLIFMYKFDLKKKRTRTLVAIYEIWGYVVPIVLTVIIFYAFSNTTRPVIEAFYRTEKNGLAFDYPVWWHAVGWTLFSIIIGLIPAYGLSVYMTRKTRCKQKKWLASVKPNQRWGPKDPADRTAWVQFKKPLEQARLKFEQVYWGYLGTVVEPKPGSLGADNVVGATSSNSGIPPGTQTPNTVRSNSAIMNN